MDDVTTTTDECRLASAPNELLLPLPSVLFDSPSFPPEVTLSA
jgi:hypothetical protein